VAASRTPKLKKPKKDAWGQREMLLLIQGKDTGRRRRRSLPGDG